MTSSEPIPFCFISPIYLVVLLRRYVYTKLALSLIITGTSLALAGIGKAADLSGQVYITTYNPSYPYAQFFKNDSFGYGSGQLSEPTRGSLVIPEAPLAGQASYTVDWQRKTFANGTWYFAGVRAAAHTWKLAADPDVNLELQSSAIPQHEMKLRLVQRRIDPGDTDYHNATVQMRSKIRMIVSFSAQQQPLTTDNAFVRFTATLTPRLNNHPNGQVAVEYHTSDASNNSAGSETVEQWSPPVSVYINNIDSFIVQLQASVGAGAYSRDNAQLVDSSESSGTVRAMMSGFQVLDMSGNLIWEYAPNADGSPGDKWALEIVDPANPNGPAIGTMAMGEPPPFAIPRLDEGGNAAVSFCGALEESTDLINWAPVNTNISPYLLPVLPPGGKFFRAHAQ